ncbi:expressed unknown protein [Seminavis robusta]|uniref:Uncharacterized protein n=1 Tax=Seminavis robusta TaxID=568900 RepID=A0A9N8DUH6_9STRA|nr:expressed unknown protein [Seminavis robusta]|eukprot:Sro360_g126300.1 n/a (576) ;mRNA; r:49945-51768
MSVETWQWRRVGACGNKPPRSISRETASKASSSCSSYRWLSQLEFIFPLPTMFPYHEPSGASVVMAGYLSSPTGTGCPSSSDDASARGSPEANSTRDGEEASYVLDNSRSQMASSLERRLNDLEFLELLQTLHEDYLQCRRPLRQDAVVSSGAKKEESDDMKWYLQSRFLVDFGDCHNLDQQRALAQIYERLSALALFSADQSGTVPVDDKSQQELEVMLCLHKIAAITSKEQDDNIFMLEVVQAHQRLGSFLQRHLAKHQEALRHYQVALTLLDQCVVDEDVEEHVAACLYGIASGLLQACSGESPWFDGQQQQACIEQAIELLTEALQVWQGMMDRLGPTESAYTAMAEILVALGDGYNQQQQAPPLKVLECYRGALSAIEKAKLDGTHSVRIDALMALGDFYSKAVTSGKRVRMGGGRDPLDRGLKLYFEETDRALTLYYEVFSVASLGTAHHEQARLKAAIVHFDRGEIGSALENLTAFQLMRHEGGNQEDLAYFIGLLSSAACHYANINSLRAKRLYEEAFGLISSKENHLLVENPMLETYMFNYVVADDDGELPFQEYDKQPKTDMALL